MLPWLHLQPGGSALFGLCAIAVAIAGCAQEGRDVLLSSRSGTGLQEVVTDSLYKFGVADGQFTMSEFRRGRPEATVDRATAEKLAKTWPTQFGRYVRAGLEERRGAAIVLSSLHPCRRTLYSAPPVEVDQSSVGPDDVSHILAGGWWIVPMCDGMEQVAMTLSISDITPVELRDGSARLQRGGGWVIWQALPVAYQSGDLLTPEGAAAYAHAQTGLRVRATPELVTRLGATPLLSRWRIALERPASLRFADTGVPFSGTELFVGPSGPTLDLAMSAPKTIASVQTNRTTTACTWCGDAFSSLLPQH